MRQKCSLLLLALFAVAGSLLAACQADPQPATVEVTRIVVETEPAERERIEVTRLVLETEIIEVTATPAPIEELPKELVICISEEPQSLFPYSSATASLPTQHVLHGLYENMVTTLSYDYQPRAIETLPSLANGGASLETVMVEAGERVVDVNGDLVVLAEGVLVRTADGETVLFEGSPVAMQQLAVSFDLQPLVWSDGLPVTADDSVYSFELAADPQTPVNKFLVSRTFSYEAMDERSLLWRGVPGFMDPTYFTNIWMPLPRHYWGSYSAEELLHAREVNLAPLSHGPFVLKEWVPGDHITLDRNVHYYLASEGLPRVNMVTFRFIPDSNQLLAKLLSGQCDIATQDGMDLHQSPFLIEAEAGGLLVPYFQDGTVFEHIDFGINPVSEYATVRPDWFEDIRMRRAMVMCTDRQRMVDEILYGRAKVIDAYVPGGHPLFPIDATSWPYDLEQANALLDAAGYDERDELGFRLEPRTGGRIRVTMMTAVGNELAEQLGPIFQENMLDCGLEVNLNYLQAAEYFADGAQGGLLFGRRFDLAHFPWPITIMPNCALYLSSRIPGPENSWDRTYNNATGYSSETFDAACNRALTLLPGMDGYTEAHQEALRIWTQDVPVIPLFTRLKVAAVRPEVTGFRIDPTQPSELWNIFEVDIDR